jgi:hypothetical protein
VGSNISGIPQTTVTAIINILGWYVFFSYFIYFIGEMQFTSMMITVKNMSSRSLHDNNDETGAEMKNKKRKMGDG